MANIIFEDRAVAFIDVLGFKNVVTNAAVNNNLLAPLISIVTLLESAIPSFDSLVDPSVHTSLVPKFIYISDCIILSAPIATPRAPSYNGLNTVVMRAIQLSHEILNLGFILSGGIAVGKVWHSGNNIIGPAYVDAYKLQDSLVAPCIQLTATAAKLWAHTPNSASMMCLDHRSRKLVNIVDDSYIPNNGMYGAINARINHYKQIASSNITHPNHRARRKWQWHAAFLNKYA